MSPLSSQCLQPGDKPAGASQPGPPGSLGPAPQTRPFSGQEALSLSGRKAQSVRVALPRFFAPKDKSYCFKGLC